MIIRLANKIGQLHGKFFLWLSHKSESHPLWAVALTVCALYEIFEHVALPTIALFWMTGDIGIK